MSFELKVSLWLGFILLVGYALSRIPAVKNFFTRAATKAVAVTRPKRAELAKLRPKTSLLQTAGSLWKRTVTRFRQGNIETRFRTYASRMCEAGETSLNVATLVQTEEIERQSNARILWGWLNLGTSVSRISVPVTYRYHLELSGEWTVSRRGRTLVVGVPPLQPTLPPAIDTSGMKKESARGWARFDSAEQMEMLEKCLTPFTAAMAASPERTTLVLETARLAAARFVQLWLSNHNQWSSSDISAIRVCFGEELLLLAPEDLHEPSRATLSLEAVGS